MAKLACPRMTGKEKCIGTKDTADAPTFLGHAQNDLVYGILILVVGSLPFHFI